MYPQAYIALPASLSAREVEKLIAAHGFAMHSLIASLGKAERYDTKDVLQWMGY